MPAPIPAPMPVSCQTARRGSKRSRSHAPEPAVPRRIDRPGQPALSSPRTEDAIRTLLALPVFAVAAPALAQPSFECAAASQPAEVAICGDPALQALDRDLAARFAAALAVTQSLGADAEAAERTLRSQQQGWAGSRDDCQSAADAPACIAASYRLRIAELVTLYLLEPPTTITHWLCEDGAEITGYLFDGGPAAIRLEWGDRIASGVLDPTATGRRYEARLGILVLDRGRHGGCLASARRRGACDRLHPDRKSRGRLRRVSWGPSPRRTVLVRCPWSE